MKLFAVFAAIPATAQTVNLAWNANPESNIAGYKVYYGTESYNHTEIRDVGNTTRASLTDLAPATTYYCAVLAYNTLGLESDLSDEISFTTPPAPPASGLVVVEQSGTPLPGRGGTVSFGNVNSGALSETRTFTVTNQGDTTYSGLAITLDATHPGNFAVTSNLPLSPSVSANGSFESALSAWTRTGNVRAQESPAATHGRQIVDFSAGDSPNNGTLSQSFSTIPGTTYSLSFDVGVLSYNTNPQRLQATVTGAGTLFSNTVTVTGTGGGITWSPQTFTFVADSDTATLTLTDVSLHTAGIDLLLDHVRVTGQPASTGGVVISSLAPGKSATFSIAFKPNAAGTQGAVLGISAADGRLFEVFLTGSASIMFDSWLASNGASGGANGNMDGDGLNNLLEYAFGCDPKSGHSPVTAETGGLLTSRGTPAVRIITSPAFEFRGLFSRRKDHAKVGLNYRPQFSADLTTWADATSTPVALADDGEIEVVSVTAPAAIGGAPARFFRVAVTQSAPLTFAGWLAQKGATGGTNGNPDGDALSNLFEYAFGTDPWTAQAKGAAEIDGLLASRGTPMPRVVTSPDFEFRGLFCRRKDHAAVGLDYRPQFSADLTTWVDAAEIPVVVADDGEIEVVSVRASELIDGKPARFFRVGVNQPGPLAFNDWLAANEVAAGPPGESPENLLGYAFGINPVTDQAKTVAESGGLFISRGAPAVRVVTSPAFKFQGLFGRRINHAAVGLNYRPQFSADLTNWVDAAETPVVLTDDAEIEVVAVQAPDQIDGMPARFFRVGVSREP